MNVVALFNKIICSFHLQRSSKKLLAFFKNKKNWRRIDSKALFWKQRAVMYYLIWYKKDTVVMEHWITTSLFSADVNSVFLWMGNLIFLFNTSIKPNFLLMILVVLSVGYVFLKDSVFVVWFIIKLFALFLKFLVSIELLFVLLKRVNCHAFVLEKLSLIKVFFCFL